MLSVTTVSEKMWQKAMEIGIELESASSRKKEIYPSGIHRTDLERAGEGRYE